MLRLFKVQTLVKLFFFGRYRRIWQPHGTWLQFIARVDGGWKSFYFELKCEIPQMTYELVQVEKEDNYMAVLIVNLVLCVVILALGIWGYSRKKSDFILYIGIAFGLFGVSHLMDILGLPTSLSALVIAIRFIAYLLVIFALYRVITRK